MSVEVADIGGIGVRRKGTRAGGAFVDCAERNRPAVEFVDRGTAGRRQADCQPVACSCGLSVAWITHHELGRNDSPAGDATFDIEQPCVAERRENLVVEAPGALQVVCSKGEMGKDAHVRSG